MYLEEIKDEKLVRLVKAANNAGGTLCEDMWVSLKEAKDEKDFERNWSNKLYNEISRAVGFHNELTERLGERLGEPIWQRI